MTDPAIALASFQAEFLIHDPELAPCAVDKDLYFYEDMPNGEYRATYFTLEGQDRYRDGDIWHGRNPED